MEGRREGREGSGWEGRGMNWTPVLAHHDHPGDQDRPGASPGALGRPGARTGKGRGGKEGEKGKEGKGTGCQSWFPGPFWCPIPEPMGQVPLDRPRELGREGREGREGRGRRERR